MATLTPMPLTCRMHSSALSADSIKIDSVISISKWSGGKPLSFKMPLSSSTKSPFIKWRTETFTHKTTGLAFTVIRLAKKLEARLNIRASIFSISPTFSATGMNSAGLITLPSESLILASASKPLKVLFMWNCGCRQK